MACSRFERPRMLVYLGGIIRFYPQILTEGKTGEETMKVLLAKMLDKHLRMSYPAEGKGIIQSYLENPETPVGAEFEESWVEVVHSLMDITKKMKPRLPFSPAALHKLSHDMFAEYVEEPEETTVTPGTVIPSVSNSTKNNGKQLDLFTDSKTESPESGGTNEELDNSVSPGTSQEDTPIVDTLKQSFVIDGTKTESSNNMTAIIKETLGPAKAHLYDDMMGFLHYHVASGWVNQEVDSDGNVGGFVTLNKATNNIKSNIQANVIKHFANTNNGEFSVYDYKTSKRQKLHYYDKANLPIGVTIAEEGDGFTIYEHKVLTSSSKSSKWEVEKIISGDSFEEVQDALDNMENIVTTVMKDYSPGSSDTSLDFLNKKNLSESEKGLFFSYVISQNYNTFINHFYPQLGKGFKSKHRTGFSERNVSGVAAGDSDSAATTMHKTTTPRLKFSGTINRPILEIDTTTPFLKKVDFDNIVKTMQKYDFRRDRNGFAEDIKNFIFAEDGKISRLGKSEEGQIMASIYFRFFAPTDYKVKVPGSLLGANGVTTTKTYRSYNGITSRNSYNDLSVEAYTDGLIKSKSSKNRNVTILPNHDGTDTYVITTKDGVLSYNVDTNPFNNKNLSINDLMSHIRPMQEALTEEDVDEVFKGKSLSKEVTDADFKPVDVYSKEKAYIATIINEEIAPWENGNDLLNMSLSSMITALSSSAAHESALSRNGKLSLTNSQMYGIDARYRDRFSNPSIAIDSQGQKFTRGELMKDVKVHASSVSNDVFSVTLKNPYGDDIKYKVTAMPIQDNGKPKDGFPFKIELSGDPLTTSDLISIYRRSTPVPRDLLSTRFINEFNSNLSQIDVKDFKGEDAFEKFLLSNLLVMEMNKQDSALKGITGLQGTSDLKFDPVDSIFGYQGIIRDTMIGVYGADNKIYSIDNNGNKIANVSVKNKITDSIVLALKHGDINSIHSNSPITGIRPDYNITGFYSKTGIMVGNIVKENQDMTVLEQVQQQIEQAGVQRAASDGKWKNMLVQFGVMSDRKDVPLVNFESNDKEFFPVNSNGKLDRTTLQKEYIKSQRDYWNGLAKDIISSWEFNLGLSGPAQSIDIEDGYVYTIEGLANADMTAFKNDNPDRPENFKIPVSIAFDILNQAMADSGNSYDYVRANLPFVENINVVKGPDNKAIIPPNVVQSVQLFNSPKLAKAFVKTHLKLFKDNLTNVGYTKLSKSTEAILTKRFRGENLFNTAVEGFFYHSNTLGNSLLRLHTGGHSQFKPGRVSTNFQNFLSIDESTGETVLDDQAVLDRAKNMPAGDTTLDKAKLEDLTNDEQIFYKSVLLNQKLDDKAKAHALLFDDILKVNSSQYIDQVKRNAGMGSTYQHPRLVGKNESGMLLGQTSKNVTIADPSLKYAILGKSGLSKVDIYDAVQIGHPLYFIRLSNSLGGSESGYNPNGAPVKDITNEMDNNGYYRFQKKATFDQLNNELLAKGSKEASALLTRMNTAIAFTAKNIMVPDIDPITLRMKNRGVFSEAVSREMWLTNGENLGFVLDTKTNKVVHASKIISDYKAKVKAADDAGLSGDADIIIREFESDFGVNPRYKTDKVSKSFNNLQDLWEYFGSVDNSKSWELVAEVIGTMSGNATKIDLSDATYPNRDAYIEKAGFKTQEKVGTKKIVDNAIADINLPLNNAWTPVDNTYHGVILQADHNPDTTSSEADSYLEDAEGENKIPMITQVLSALIAEGNTMGLASDAFDAVGTASASFLYNLEQDMKDSENELVKSGMKAEDARKKVVIDYLRGLVKDGLAGRESAGIVGELVEDRYSDSLSFDLKQVLPLATSMLNAKFNKETVRQKFKGGQFVVSPSHDFIKLYQVKSSDGQVIASGLTRLDVNNILKSRESVNPDLYDALSANSEFIETPVNPDDILPTDLVKVDVKSPFYKDVDIKVGEYYRVSELKRKIKGVHSNMTDTEFKRLLADTTKSRLGNLDVIEDYEDKDRKNTLKWSSYYKYNNNGVRNEIKKHPKYQAFQAIDEINDSTITDISLVPDELIKFYFFEKYDLEPRMKQLSGATREYVRDVWTPSDEAKFYTWLKQKSKEEYIQARLDTFNYVKEEMAKDPYFRKRAEKRLYDELETGGWINESAEFFMPSMHAKAFLIEDGDSVINITGGIDPDFNALLSLGILKSGTYTDGNESITFRHPEDIRRYLEMHHSAEFGNKYKNRLDVIFRNTQYNNLSDNHKKLYDKVMNQKNKQYGHSVVFFRGKVQRKYSSLFNMIYNSKSIDEALSTINSKLKTVTTDSSFNKALTQFKSILEDGNAEIEETKNTENPTTESRVLLRLKTGRGGKGDSEIERAFYSEKANKLASGFPTTLEFITARIPAQGMQSVTSGKIKNFIFSTRNSCYGPLEMLTMTGADYDIDKQNMMTWAVTNDGEIIDWNPFLDNNGKISYNKYLEWKKGTNMSTKEAVDYYKKATQNFIVHKILSTIKDPVNAIQANTPVSMNKLNAAKRKPDLTKARFAESLSELIDIREHASPYSPHNIFKYEKLNMDGKSGIGIFASDLKSYFATYYATIMSDRNAAEHIRFKTNTGLSEAESEEMGINPNAIQYFDVYTGDVVESETLANGSKFTNKGRLNSDNAIKYKKAIVDAGTDVDKQYEALRSYIEDVGIIGNINVEEQAWEDLSELLSAATDNAKELILGEINATSSTSSIISTMIRMGIDLKYALQLVGHDQPFSPAVKVKIGSTVRDISTVRDLIAFTEEAADTQTNIAGNSRLLTVLEEIQPTLEKLPKDKYLKHPFRQLYSFASMTEEFGLMSTALSINQGLKNGDFDVWKFITGFEARMNDILQKVDPNIDFNLELFISQLAAANDETNTDPVDTSYVNKIIKTFDKARVGINVPYILSRNKHFFGYYQAMFKSKALLNEVSSIGKIVDNILTKKEKGKTLVTADINSAVDRKNYKALQDYVYGVGVEMYLDSLGKTVVINGMEFDLTIPSSPFTSANSIGGRLEFINHLPTAVRQEAESAKEENYFLDSLPTQTVVEDYDTKILVPILKGPNLNEITSERRTRLELGLQQLESSNKQLYDALFLYSLITTKGGFAGGSFMSLYDTSKYGDYAKYIRSKSKVLESWATHSDLNETILYNNSFLIRSVTTSVAAREMYAKKAEAARKNKQSPDAEISQEEVSGYAQEASLNEEQHFSEEFYDGEEIGSRRRSLLDMKADQFDTIGITQAKKSGAIKEDTVVSAETGIIYIWNKDLQLWIPRVQSLPNVIIPYSTVAREGKLSDTGFTEGWDFQLNEVDSSMTPKKAKIISYADRDILKRLSNENDPLYSKVEKSNISQREDNYIVKVDNRYKIMTAKQILDGTKTNINLHKGRIALSTTINKGEEVVSQHYKFYKDRKTGTIFFTEPRKGVEYDKSTWTTIRPSMVGKSRTLYGKVDIKTIHDIVKKEKDGEYIYKTELYTQEKLEREFKKLKEDYLNTAFKDRFDNITSHDDSKLFTSKSDIATAKVIYNEAEDLFNPQKHILEKMNMLYERNKLFEGFEIPAIKTTGELPTAMPNIVRNVLVKPAALESVNWDTLERIFRNVGITGGDFKKLVKASLLKRNDPLDVYVSSTTDKVIFKDKKAPSFQTPMSKEHTAPESFRQSFNKKASPEVLNNLARFFNKKFPNTTFSVIGTKEIETLYGKEYAKDGVKAFVMNGEVIINSERATLDSPLHEFTHVYMQHLKVDNRDLYLKIVNDSLKHPLAKHMRKSYPQISEYELGEEVFVSLVSAHATGNVLETESFKKIAAHTSSGKNIFAKITNFFKSLFSDFFGTDLKDYSIGLDSSLNEIIENVGDKIAFSDKSALSDISSTTKIAMKNARLGAEMDYKQAKQFLVDRGFIKVVCT